MLKGVTQVDSKNSTTTVLGGNSVYAGTYSSTTGYNSVQISIRTSLDSASSGLKIYSSTNGLTGQSIYSDTYFGGTNYDKLINLPDQYYRIEYTNGPTGQTGPFSLTSRLSTDLNNNSQNAPPNLYSYTNNPEVDAFGKLRVTNPFTLLDIKFPGQTTGSTGFLSSSETICTRIIGGTGTLTYGNSQLKVTGWTGSGLTGSFVSQSRKYCTYQPGKSLLFLGSGVLNPNGTNPVTAYTSIGYYDDTNGVFFSNDSSGVSINIRSNGSSVSKIYQTNWNIDKMDGTGQSGLTLDFTKAQLFVIDLEWLGVGRVRYGFYAYGKIFYCHQITNVNGLTGPYMISPNLPIRYEIGNTGATGASLTQICSTIISEGGYNPEGRPFSVSGVTGVDGTERPILAISGQTGNNNYKNQNIIPNSITLFSPDANKSFSYNIRLYQSSSGFTGTSWQSVNSNYSVVHYAVGTGIGILPSSGSIIVQTGYFTSKTSVSFNSLQNTFGNILQLTKDANNINDVLVITATALGTSGDCYASIDWQEVY